MNNSFKDILKEVLEFERDSNKLSDEIILEVTKRGQSIIPKTTDDVMCIRELVFLNQTIKIFNGRIDFLIDFADKMDSGADIIRVMLRMLIDTYAQMLFLANEKDKLRKFKVVIWEELGILPYWGIDGSLEEGLERTYKLIKELEIEVPSLDRIIDLSKQHMDTGKKPGELNSLANRFGFPSTATLINLYHNDKMKPSMDKAGIHMIYITCSKQLHGNRYSEGYDDNNHTIFQVYGIIPLIHMSFLREAYKLLKLDSKNLIKHFEHFTTDIQPRYQQSWKEASSKLHSL